MDISHACARCDKEFKSAEALIRHAETEHSRADPLGAAVDEARRIADSMLGSR